MKPRQRSLLTALLLLSMTLTTGCLGLGGKTVERVTFVNLYDEAGREVIAGRIAKNVKVPIVIVTTDGELVKTEMDIGGWNVSHPSPPKEEAKPKE